jgi:hypothetical protein
MGDIIYRKLKMHEIHFPWGLAEGAAFLGRKKEITQLKNNLLQGYHSLLLAPRRYGKTSLAKHVIRLVDFPYVEIDFFTAQNEFSIEQKILKGVQSILDQIKSSDRWLNVLINFFKKANKTWIVGIKGLKLQLVPDNHQDVPENILDALNALEHVLSKKKQPAVLFIDEFQEIANIASSQAIEGAIRHFAQSSKYVRFIFSGSSRHMLKHMFGDKTRPLYALCREIHLDRLIAHEYRDYLNKIAFRTWHQRLDDLVFEKIIEMSACHPRYVYHLCTFLWDHCEELKRSPKVHDVETAWVLLTQDKLKDTRDLLSKQGSGQVKILALIALAITDELTGKLAQSKLGISGSAITQALRNLEQDDFVEKIHKGSYRVIDPIVKSILIQYGSDYFV